MVVPYGKEAVIEAFSLHYPEDEEGVRKLLDVMERVTREMAGLPNTTASNGTKEFWIKLDL